MQPLSSVHTVFLQHPFKSFRKADETATTRLDVCVSLRLSALNNANPTRQIFLNFQVWDFYLTLWPHYDFL